MGKHDLLPLQIEQPPIGDLKLDPRNARQHSDLQIGQIARSIDTFGFNVPILIDGQNIVIAGHGRLRAARKLGWTTVPVIRLTHLTAAQARAFAIADNRLTENSTWDDRLLGEVFRDLATLDLDFSLEVTGFSIPEIDLRIEGLADPATGQPDPADLLPEVPNPSPVTSPGDLWILGKHKILCGDPADPASYSALMQTSKAALVFTTPACDHRRYEVSNSEMKPSQSICFLKTVFQLLARYGAPGSIHFLCMDWRHQLELLTAGNQVYTELKDLCVWVKAEAAVGSLYRTQHELIFVFQHGHSGHADKAQLAQGRRRRTNVWKYPSEPAGRRKGKGRKVEALPAGAKPVAMVVDALLDCSAAGDIVLDPFLGSGTTLIAAERASRVCRGIESDPIHLDTAIRRWQHYCGSHAIHAASGKRFDEITAQRLEVQHG